MTVEVVIAGDTDVALWHLPSRERLRRQIALESTLTLATAESAAASRKRITVAAGFLFDGTTLSELAKRDESALIDPDTEQVAAVVSGILSAGEQQALMQHPLPGDNRLRPLTPADLAVYNDKLRRNSAPTLAALNADARAALEAQLYGASYKGITDLVTKWLWPAPAKQGVKACAALGITPNQVTLLGALLMLLALWLFSQGQFFAGLAAGWFMTYLDTVDGKLARVTVQSSKLGHVLDHGMDIVHPPFWYWAWGMGLVTTAPVFESISLTTINYLIFGGYIAGRVIEGAFHSLASCGLFSWRPFDAYFRLITGRRNPCMILLTVGWALGRPDLGLLWVALWTAASSFILLLRLLQAAWIRSRSEPLQSWLASTDAATQHPRAFSTFSATRAAYEVR
ncbi:MAG: CDP-alcohol phosphatidyltransferase family protein [Pseudomonadales bacterium]